MTKSLVLNKSSLNNRTIRALVKWLISIWKLKNKIRTDEIINILYKVKDECLVKEKPVIKKEKQVKCTPKVIFKEVKIKTWEKFHVVKKKKQTPKNRPKKVIKETEEKKIKFKKPEKVLTKHKYKQWDLLEFIQLDSIEKIFTWIKKEYYARNTPL